MKYWMVIWLTGTRSSGPDTDHRLLASTPMVSLPGCSTPTAVAPMDHLPLPVARWVPVGSRNVGPTPQISGPWSMGEKKNAGLMSPNPDEPPPLLATSG